MWQVTTPHFCAGLIVNDRVCVAAAPILGWAVGKPVEFLRNYFKGKHWTVEEIP